MNLVQPAAPKIKKESFPFDQKLFDQSGSTFPGEPGEVKKSRSKRTETQGQAQSESLQNCSLEQKEATRTKQSFSRRGFLNTNPKLFHTKETKEKISQSTKKRSKNNVEIVTCPWCGKVGRNPGMKINHFENCKLNPTTDLSKK